MKEPLKPLPTDCCGTGCRRCVYEIYEEQLARYKEWKSQEAALPADRNSK
ncbi:MAG: oxidoreductase-like domain-containing protein [Candidatus Halalkalibacterium sp. M3_1C_030]